MKKFIAILLSVMMLFSCLSVFASAEEGSESLLDKVTAKIDFEEALKQFNFDSSYLDGADTGDVDALLSSEYAANIDILGINLDEFYHSTDVISWANLPFDKGDVAIVYANINTYLASCVSAVMKGSSTSPKFCTVQNATKITNFIGHILDPRFEDVVITDLDNAVDLDTIYDNFNTANKFYGVIAQLSGLAEIMQKNWCDRPDVNYMPVLYLLGFDFNDDAMLGASRLKDAYRIAPVLIKSVIDMVGRIGPVEYIFQVVSKLAATYGVSMEAPIKALLKAHIAAGTITSEELGTLKGLFNVISNGNNPARKDCLQFVSVPAYRFASCTKIKSGESSASVDTNTMFLYALVYCNLVGANSGSTAIETLKAKVNAESALSGEQKSTISSIIDGMFMGKADGLMTDMLGMFTNNIGAVGENLWDKFVAFFVNYFESIAHFFSKIFDSLLNFGKF